MGTLKRSILLVEDAEDVHVLVRDVLESINPDFVLLSALSLSQGEDLFCVHVDRIGAVLMDGCVDALSNRPDSLELIRFIRRTGWDGPIVAIPSLTDFWPDMKAAGCTDAWPKHKILERLPELIGS